MSPNQLALRLRNAKLDRQLHKKIWDENEFYLVYTPLGLVHENKCEGGIPILYQTQVGGISLVWYNQTLNRPRGWRPR